MSADVNIPDKYTITLAGAVDMDLDNIHIVQIPTITLAPVTATANLSGSMDIGLDNIHIKELPKIDLDVGIKPTRIHMPMNTHICLSVLGINLLRLSVCGENMVITEPYLPHRAELQCH